jgi:hypothetical protein
MRGRTRHEEPDGPLESDPLAGRSVAEPTSDRRHPARRPLAPALTARRLVEVLGPLEARRWWVEVGVELDRLEVLR